MCVWLHDLGLASDAWATQRRKAASCRPIVRHAVQEHTFRHQVSLRAGMCNRAVCSLWQFRLWSMYSCVHAMCRAQLGPGCDVGVLCCCYNTFQIRHLISRNARNRGVT